MRIWLLTAVTLLACAVAWTTLSSPEAKIRGIGTILQLAGIVTVLLGLRGTSRLFKRHSMWQTFMLMLERLPRFGQRQTISGSATLVEGDDFLSARARVGPIPNAPLDTRIGDLEQRHAELFDEVGKLGDDLKRSKEDIAATISKESVEREHADTEIQNRLELAVAGNLKLDYVGVFYFIFGTILGGLSQEFAKMLAAYPN